MMKRKDTSVRQKEIISAARRIIVEYGSENITIRRIAKEIGVSEPDIYRHFKNKKEILLLLIDDVKATWNEDIEKNYSGELSSLETLEKIILAQISAIEQRRGVTFLVIAEIISLGDKQLNKKVNGIIDAYINRIRDILADGVKAGIISQQVDLKAASKLFFCMIQGIVNIWALNQFNSNLDLEYQPLWRVFTRNITKSSRSLTRK